jgi:hypothetical protein
MKFLKLFENFDGDIISHLKERGIDPEQTRLIIDEKDGDTYFFLYNLSGQMVGYQKYNPKYPKIGQRDNVKHTKYYNWVTDEDDGKKIAVWGLESYHFTDRFLFITEGIFDTARVHQSGYPGIAVLCSDPSDQLKGWLKTIPQKKIVIYDNDKAGLKLRSVGDFSYSIEGGKDLNDLNPEESKLFLDDCLRKSNLL